MQERYDLALERIKNIPEEQLVAEAFRPFFSAGASFLIYVDECLQKALSGELYKLSLDSLRDMNKKLYELPKETDNSCLNALSAEIHSVVPHIFEKDIELILIRMELFLEFYSSCVCANEEGYIPKDEDFKSILYYYVSDYSDLAMDRSFSVLYSYDEDFVTGLINNLDWSDLRSLYFTGEYITEAEENTLRHLNELPRDVLKKMADTFTEGYRIGFEVTNKSLEGKKIVNVRFGTGFEPVVKIAIDNFKSMGLKPAIKRSKFDLLNGRGIVKNGYFGACVDRQYEYDHREDSSLILDSKLLNIKLEAMKRAFEKRKEEAKSYAGPAVIEFFGEKAPEYVNHENVLRYSDEQNKLIVKNRTEMMQLQSEYLDLEGTSFTIIAFPTSDIGKDYKEIFDEVIKLNTLDYMLYRNVQQTIIDTLDKGEYALIKGGNGNTTNLKVSLISLPEPDKQTKFENCVADVNIPVGEVFTSPVLKGTDGTLNVKRVFLNGLEYKNLTIEVKDGMIKDYSCENFDSIQKNREYFEDNVLYKHETLPMGEFAIGTNTVAYVMGKKYGIEDRLPILIAEKTGPHFAFGDTCYSHSEDVVVFNPDGKEIYARDNEISVLRKEDPSKAYFNCHTDVTIPFDELSEISIVTKDEEVITIIEDGRFVLPGTEVLNSAF